MAVFIVRRTLKNGEVRWDVRVQQSRRAVQVHLGTFRLEKHAKARRAWALGELAAGRFPDPRSIQPPAATSVLSEIAGVWLASRIDVADSSRDQFKSRIAHLTAAFGDRDPASVTRDEAQAWLGGLLAKPLQARTVQSIAGTAALIFDHAGVEPNPIRQTRKPRVSRELIVLPRRRDVERLLAVLPEQHADACRLLEATGLRISELVRLQWGDLQPGRLRVQESKTAAGRMRWVPCDDLPVRPEGVPDTGRVFPGLTRGKIRETMRHRSRRLGLDPEIHPHLLRHLYASRMLHQGGVGLAELAARLGHRTPAITLETYAHVVPPD